MKTASSLELTTQFFVLLLTCFSLHLLEPTAAAASYAVALWRFDEGGGTNILDSSGLGNDGSLAGENSNVPVRVAGQAGFGSALRFTNNSTDHAYVTIPGAASLLIGQTATNPWTITAWAYEDSNGTGDYVANYGRIMVLDDGTAFQLESGASGDGQLYTWARANAPWQVGWGTASTVAPLLDQWEHWAVVYDGTNLTIYRNANQGPQGGISSTPVTSPLAFPGYTGAVLIGSELDQSADRTWNGLLDDVAVFAGALTQAQIATVMSGDFSSFIGGPAAIISQPQSQTVPQGSSVTFNVGAQGQSPLQYQWYFNDTNKLSSANNPTATNATLVLTNVQLSQSGTYSVVVGNSINSVISQPATLAVYKATLVGLWRFDEGGGTNILDSSGLGNDGSLAGENSNVPVRVAGQAGFGSALRFTNNSTDHAYVTIPGAASLLIGQTATNPWTITAWAYEDSNGTGDHVANYGRIMVLDDGTAFQLESGASGDGQLYTWARANAPWQVGWGTASTVAPLLDQWEHWAVVYDGTNLTIYRNANQGPQGGISSTPVTSPLAFPGYTGAVLIGSELDQSADRTWNGLLDDVAVFNIALSTAQIESVMAGNFSTFVPQPQLLAGSSSGEMILSWPAAQSTFQLQSTTNLIPAFWVGVSTPPVRNDQTLTVTLPIGTGTRFFRLTGP